MLDEDTPQKQEGLSPEWQEIRDFATILRPLAGEEMIVQKEGDPKSRGTTKRAIGFKSQVRVTCLPENRKENFNGYTTSPVMKIFQGPNGKFLCVTQTGSKYEVEGATLTSFEQKQLVFDDDQNVHRSEPKEPPKAPTFLDRIRRLFRQA